MNDVLFSSNSNEWETPQMLFNQLDQIFDFTLDPCATDSNHKCEKYYTKEQNGLAQSWENERVFVNPPYGREIEKWCRKCWLEMSRAECIVELIPARTDTTYFHKYILGYAHYIFFVKGRLHFSNSAKPAPFPSMIVIYNHGKYIDCGVRNCRSKIGQYFQTGKIIL